MNYSCELCRVRTADGDRWNAESAERPRCGPYFTRPVVNSVDWPEPAGILHLLCFGWAPRPKSSGRRGWRVGLTR
jgi:hypothetical protein